MKIPNNYIGPNLWRHDKELYEYEAWEITIQDIVDARDLARIEEEVQTRLEKLRQDGRQWELDAVLVGSPIENRNTCIIFRVRRASGRG